MGKNVKCYRYKKETEMCLPGMSSGGGGGVDPAAQAEADEKKRQNLETRKERRQDVLSQTIAATQRGSGRRSLITGPGGGMGYFNRYRT